MTEQIWNITNHVAYLQVDNWTALVKIKLENFETSLIKAIKKDGWDGIESTETRQWTLHGALFYSIILITTIGQLRRFSIVLHYLLSTLYRLRIFGVSTKCV